MSQLSTEFNGPGELSSTSTIICPEGVFIKSLKDVHDPIDARLDQSSHPNPKYLGESLERQLSKLAREESEKGNTSTTLNGIIYIDFEESDKRNPANFSVCKKWVITITAVIFTAFASFAASAYNMGFTSMTRDLNCTQFQATIGLSVYALGFGVVPLVTASFSEEFGRRPLYIVSGIGFGLMYVMVALAKNIQTVIIARFLQGAFGSTGATMVGGTIADIWPSHERGLPMSIFTLAAIGSNGLGPVVNGWVEMNPHLGWKWIQWIQMIIYSVYFIFMIIFLKETRAVVLITRIAKNIRKETGDNRYRARIEDERASLRTLIFTSCTRPIHLMFTEPIIISFSLWLGFAWGVIYCMIASINEVIGNLHNFNIGEIGSTFATLIIGSFIGFATNMYQETLYKKYFPKRGPEARLYMACVSAILLPIGMFIYAWSSYKWVHWIAQMIGITVFFWAAFVIYLAVFSYLADCYGPFASSALAGQNITRNIMGTVFPLFIEQMIHKLGYRWANTVFGFFGVLMVPIPFVIFFYGPSIRRRSKFSRIVMEAQATK